MARPMRIAIVALAAVGTGLSGSDRIFIELARRWSKAGADVTIFVWEEGQAMLERNGLAEPDIALRLVPARRWRRPFPVSYVARTLLGLRAARAAHEPFDVVYAASDFWPDVFTAARLARRDRAALVGSWYLTATPPFAGKGPHTGHPVKGAAYWLSQRVVLPIVRRRSRLVFVTSEPDREVFRATHGDEDVVVIRGGVDLALSASVPEPPAKDYDGVFIGRMHPQKGPLELVGIWERVVAKRPDARLAMIGDGPLIEQVKASVRQRGLEDLVDFYGFLDGRPKIEVFRRARVVVHPAVYDSGGMAACEAMSCGLPGVSFDLEALRMYYARGMLKAPCFDEDAFAALVLRLLEDPAFYAKTSREALDWAAGWDWDSVAKRALAPLVEAADPSEVTA